LCCKNRCFVAGSMVFPGTKPSELGSQHSRDVAVGIGRASDVKKMSCSPSVYKNIHMADCQNAVSQIIWKMVVYYGARIKRFTCGMTSPHVCGNVVKLQNV